MKKFLLPLLFLLSYLPSQATQSSVTDLQKCIGATALLLSTLSGLENIKDKDNTKTIFQGLQVLQKDLKEEQAAKELYDAIGSDNYKNAIRLLKDKPDLHINARFTDIKSTSLMRCCYRGDESIHVVKDILKHLKFDITIKNCYGCTCLHYACIYGRPKIMSSFLKREDIGKILHAIDNDGRTPLDKIVYQVKKSRAKIEHISIWNMMVTKGAQLSKYKDEYKQLNSDDFKPPHSDYVDLIKSNPPKKVKVFKEPFLGRKMNSNQQGKIEDTEGYQHKDESKEKK